MQAAPEPEQERPEPRTPAEAFGRRMFDLADILLPPTEEGLQEKRKFGHLMQEVAERYGELDEATFYDRVREATGLLPMTRAQERAFAVKIKVLLEEMARDE